MKFLKSLFIITVLLGLAVNFSPAQQQTVAWTENDDLEGGLGGLEATWTNMDSAFSHYTAWTTQPTLYDGQATTEFYYKYSGTSGDSISVKIEATIDEGYAVVVDTIGLYIVTSATGTHKLITLSGYGRKYRVLVENVAPTGDGAKNSDDSDLWIGIYPALLDPQYSRKSFTDQWP